MQLRSALPSDIETVMALETAGFPPGIVEDRSVFERRIAAFPLGFLLAGEPAWGYFCAEIWSGDDRGVHRFHLGHDIVDFLDPQGDTLYVASMTVDPKTRGTGMGRRLFLGGLEWMRCQFPALSRSVLIVNEFWTGARRIYQGAGFLETGRLAGFFRPEQGPPGDAIVMEWDFRSGALERG